MGTVSVAERLSYYRLDEARITLLRQMWHKIEPHVPELLEQFYAFFTRHPASQVSLQGRDIEKLIQAQTEHWRALFECRFDEAFLSRAKAVGSVHEQIGITPFLYVGGYSFILNRLSDIILRTHRLRPAAGRIAIRALNALVLMDMELALTSYVDASNAVTAESTSNNLADRLLDRSIGIAVAANDVALENVEMMTALEQVDQEVQGISSAVEELVAGIHTISENSRQTAEHSQETRATVLSGRAAVDQAAGAMDQVAGAVNQGAERIGALAEASSQIGDMVATIEDIASRTNLLALNATIEAARAGEAGKGFAVVAGEVKNLSGQTARATEDIRQRIARLQGEIDAIVTSMRDGEDAVTHGQAVMQETSTNMEKIASRIEATSTRMADMARVLDEQRQAAHDVGRSIEHIARLSAGNVATIHKGIKAIQSVENLISAQVDELAGFDIPNKVVRIAKKDHIVWKKRLAEMLLGATTLQVEELTDHRQCRLGKWYYGDDSMDVRSLNTYKALEDPHRRVHQCGMDAVRLYNDGNHKGALAALEEVERASKDVISLLDRLAHEAGGTDASKAGQQPQAA